MPRVSEEHLTARREQILAAARTCFLSKGLHNTSMQDLIQEAGLSVGAVYRYFKSKHEIINAIAMTVAGGFQQHIDAVAAERLPMIESIEQIITGLDPQIGPGGSLPIALQIWAEATLDPAIGEIVKERYTGMRLSLQAVVEHSVQSGELPPDTDVAGVTSALYSLIPGYALQRLLTGGPDRDTYLAGVRALLHRG
ncbi:TetR/AcrR family transcriptional regulator [Paractinoplanes durhamensis]|uniref:Transcriptional regulator, TetR family protein n=1 Tax=Paractinoplanes durhamensis TaxID=113563 RepID=A0ABQ3YQ90_9ACTN|nr:TetR/AcrR family transcriptional regulator [Actinoplanes durhamensis]GID99518.1 putative transcriptional regulator, TetR family protein [Actinoplanes durhamensis]